MRAIQTGILLLAATLAAFLSSYSWRHANIQQKDKYELASSWPALPDSLVLGQVTGIGIDTGQHIFLFHRAERQWTTPFPSAAIASNTILELDAEKGSLLNSWGGGYFVMPHGLTVDADNNIWVTDVALQQVFKFTHDGKLLMTIGEAGFAGHDSLHFNMPTDVAVCKNGSFYVSDGYGNSRIVKFSASGQYLFEWGARGEDQGEFKTPHGIDLDENENVYVADRENNRIQKFDPQGKFLAQWKNSEAKQLYSLSIEKPLNRLFAIDYIPIDGTSPSGSDILFFGPGMKPEKRLGRSGDYHGDACRYHDIAVDRKGNIYVGDILGNQIQKFNRISSR